MSDPAAQIRVLEEACHRVLNDPDDEAHRASLLASLVAYKATPVDCFSRAVGELVAKSRAQADTLCMRILETDGHGRSIEAETKQMCETLASLGKALRMPG